MSECACVCMGWCQGMASLRACDAACVCCSRAAHATRQGHTHTRQRTRCCTPTGQSQQKTGSQPHAGVLYVMFGLCVWRVSMNRTRQQNRLSRGSAADWDACSTRPACSAFGAWRRDDDEGSVGPGTGTARRETAARKSEPTSQNKELLVLDVVQYMCFFLSFCEQFCLLRTAI